MALEDLPDLLARLGDAAGRFKLDTLDNPGWHITAPLPEPLASDGLVKEYGDPETDASWVDCRVRDGVLHCGGGARQLGELVSTFAEVLGLEVAKNDPSTDALQAWYVSRCNGDWEHGGGAHLDVSRKPWRLTLNFELGYPEEPRYEIPAECSGTQDSERVGVHGDAAGMFRFLRTLPPGPVQPV